MRHPIQIQYSVGVTLYSSSLLILVHCIISLSEAISYDLSINRRPHYQPESFSFLADNGPGLILRAITKNP